MLELTMVLVKVKGNRRTICDLVLVTRAGPEASSSSPLILLALGYSNLEYFIFGVLRVSKSV